MSKEEFARMTPVNPPTVNRNTNPIDHSMGESIDKCAFVIVAIQLKILIPVGMAMIIVADVKYARVSMSIPTVNMWCAHTRNPRNPIVSIA
jgi:hypothetical protein